MGYHIHHAIVCASWNDKHIVQAHNAAIEIFENQCVSPLVKGIMNGYHSFFIAPDGSKEHWSKSDDFDEYRKKFKAWLIDRNLFLDWAEIAFGGDDPEENVYIEQGHYREVEDEPTPTGA